MLSGFSVFDYRVTSHTVNLMIDRQTEAYMKFHGTARKHLDMLVKKLAFALLELPPDYDSTPDKA